MGRHLKLVLALGAIALAACGDGDSVEECEDGDPSCDEPGSQSLLGAGAASYSEAQDTANGNAMGGESTGYVLETERGLAITGSFESGSPTPDQYVFNSGTLGGAREPDFPGVDIRVVIDGKAAEAGMTLGLDTVQEFGYSSLLGSSYFMNAALMSGKDYVLRLSPAASLAGKSYTIEIRGHQAER
jgi:hypothetical protein